MTTLERIANGEKLIGWQTTEREKQIEDLASKGYSFLNPKKK